MALYTPNPAKLLNSQGVMISQPVSIDIGNFNNESGSQPMTINGTGILYTLETIASWPRLQYVTVFEGAHCKVTMRCEDAQSRQMSWGIKIYYDNNEVFQGSYSQIYYAAQHGLLAGIIFFKNENKFITPMEEDYNQGGWVHHLTTVTIDQLLTGSVVTEDPYMIAPDSGEGGGYGDFDYSGDSILPPDLPSITVADSGFVTLYAPTLAQIQSLAQYMWSGLFDISNFRKLFADPMDCIISLNILPVDIPAGTAQELKVGNIGTGISINKLGAQFIKIMFAAKNIGVRTKSFMDYSPYVKAQLFLPFIGARTLSIDEIAGADITIEYHIDLFSGACTAYVTINKSNSDGSTIKSSLYQFNGNICANIPFTATNYSGFLGSLLNTAVATTTALATQGGSSAIAGALSSGIDTATAIKPDVERSGNMSATNGFLGIQKPYLIITYPHLCKPASRDKTVGTPSFIGLSDNKHLSAFHGFTRLHKINVKGIPCTEEERQMIETLLTGEGVIMP